MVIPIHLVLLFSEYLKWYTYMTEFISVLVIFDPLEMFCHPLGVSK